MGKLFQWDGSYSVGVTEFDNDHRTLLDLGNDVVRAALAGELKQSIGEVLDQLIDYAGQHFAKEENLMQETGYADFENHHQEHKRLLTDVRLFKSQYLAGDIHPEDVAKFLVDWIVVHIQQEDKKYEGHFKSRGYC